jgi:hypothetical protein
MKISYPKLVLFLALGFQFCNFAHAEEELWKSGMNLYIKTATQDKNKSGQYVPNQHPVNLSSSEIRNALNNIYVWNKSYFAGALKENEAETVFSQEQARLLGNYLAVGLQKASPQEDFLFSLTRRKKGFLFTKDTTYTTGRAFYANDKLNIIIGEFDRLGDKFKERAYASSGISEIQYNFKHGKRAKRGDFKKAIIVTDGLSTQTVNGKNRTDWFVVDVKLASAAYLAEQNSNSEITPGVNEEALRKEAARSAQERREMRLEMARMRKQMKQSQKVSEPDSVEERLKKLDDLKQKKIITQEEYESKRQQILSEI